MISLPLLHLLSSSTLRVYGIEAVPKERRILAATPYVAELRIPYDHFGPSRKDVVERIRSALKSARALDGVEKILSITDIRISEAFETAKDVLQSQNSLPESLHAIANSLPLTDRRKFVWRLVVPMARIAWNLKRVDTGLETGGDYWPQRISTAKEVAAMPTELLFLSLCYARIMDLRQQRVLVAELIRRRPKDGYVYALATEVYGHEGEYTPLGAKADKNGMLPSINIPLDIENSDRTQKRAFELLPNHPSIGYAYACRFLLKKDKPQAIKLIKRYLAAYPKPLNRVPAREILKELESGL